MSASGLAADPTAFYVAALRALQTAGVPFVVGGAYALSRYTGIFRDTKDLDVFVRPRHAKAALDSLAAAGYRTELTFPHWLGKGFAGDHTIDIIFSSGNGFVQVDDGWFDYAVDDSVLGVPARLCPPEEMLWSKAFIMERERYDGADIAHLLQAQAESLDWQRLVQRFDSHWRVLLSHLVLFGFVYPSERGRIPAWTMAYLMGRLTEEWCTAGPADRICCGTLLSRAQYLVDVESLGYRDARLLPGGTMTANDVAEWTAAIEAPTPTIQDPSENGDAAGRRR
ncbi:MAG TPA: nucleotidyltransferase [Methylomirabilota bacterium]|nr:nucleotidyltransferase [Methylomirabilota bacterium]